jgi:hypothetical protein
MVKKYRHSRRSRSHRQKSKRHSRSHHKRSRRNRRQGGHYVLEGAPIKYTMGTMTAQSLSQGTDFAARHATQHGGMAPMDVIGKPFLASNAELQSAGIAGLDNAVRSIAGMKDQAGGRRRRKSTRRRSSRKRRTVRRRRGGAMSFAPTSWSGMLPVDHNKAGLNPHWKGVETDAAMRRGTM